MIRIRGEGKRKHEKRLAFEKLTLFLLKGRRTPLPVLPY